MPKPTPAREPDPMAGVVDRLLAQLPGLQGEAVAARVDPRQPVQAGNTAPIFRVRYANEPTPLAGVIALWARVSLALSLGIMMAAWPYSRACGAPLFGYFCAVLTVVLAGGWAAVAAWRYRHGLGHVLSLILMLYGIILAAAELLPRTGYAINHATWTCDYTASSHTTVQT